MPLTHPIGNTVITRSTKYVQMCKKVIEEYGKYFTFI